MDRLSDWFDLPELRFELRRVFWRRIRLARFGSRVQTKQQTRQ